MSSLATSLDLWEASPAPPPRIARLVNVLTAPRSSPELVQRLHEWVYDRSAGRVGHGMIGSATLLLYTTGRRTGRRRRTALCYVRDGGRFIVAATNGGADKTPAWLHNIRAELNVELRVGRLLAAGRALVIGTGAPDYERLWTLIDRANNGRYRAYRTKTARMIPLVAIAR